MSLSEERQPPPNVAEAIHRGFAELGGVDPESPPPGPAPAPIDELAQRLARLTGEDALTAVERALEERLSRLATSGLADRQAALQAFFNRISKLPVMDPRDPDAIIGYDADGLPSS